MPTLALATHPRSPEHLAQSASGECAICHLLQPLHSTLKKTYNCLFKCKKKLYKAAKGGRAGMYVEMEDHGAANMGGSSEDGDVPPVDGRVPSHTRTSGGEGGAGGTTHGGRAHLMMSWRAPNRRFENASPCVAVRTEPEVLPRKLGRLDASAHEKWSGL